MIPNEPCRDEQGNPEESDGAELAAETQSFSFRIGAQIRAGHPVAMEAFVERRTRLQKESARENKENRRGQDRRDDADHADRREQDAEPGVQISANAGNWSGPSHLAQYYP